MALGEFSWTQAKDSSVRIAFRGKVVTTLGGQAAARFAARAADVDEEAQQHLMARATGNFKHGNERRAGG